MLASASALSIAAKRLSYELTTDIYVTQSSSVPRLSQLVNLLRCELHAHRHAVDSGRSHSWELLRHQSLPLLLLENVLLAYSSHCARVVHPN